VLRAPFTGAWLVVRKASIWNEAPAGVANPSIISARSRPTTKPPLHSVVLPLVGLDIVAYSPLPILRTAANPLSTIGVCDIRESTPTVSAAPAEESISPGHKTPQSTTSGQ